MAEDEIVQMGLRVPKHFRDALEELGELQGRSLNAVAIRAFEEHLAKHVLAHEFDDAVRIDKDRDVVFCWLTNTTSGERVRVEASRAFVEDNWNVRWSNEDAVIKAFRKHRGDYLDAASRAPSGGKAIRVFALYNSQAPAAKKGKRS